MPSLLLYVDSLYLSPYAMAAWVALREKGLAFDVRTLDLEAQENLAPAYADASVTRRVPTLVHDGFHLSESSAICEYIEDVFPGARLYPAAPRERAVARQVQAWIRSDLLPLRMERSTEVVFRGVRGAPLSPAAQAAADRLVAAAEKLLAPGAEHLFDAWSIADLDLALVLNRLALHGDPLPARLADYAARQWQRPSVQEWVRRERPAP